MYSPRLLHLGTIVALASVSLAVASQPIPLDSLASAHATENGLPALIVGIIADGERWVVGATDGTGVAPDAHTLFEIGSVSKVLTALALADAVAQGETALDTPVADLLASSIDGWCSPRRPNSPRRSSDTHVWPAASSRECL